MSFFILSPIEGVEGVESLCCRKSVLNSYVKELLQRTEMVLSSYCSADSVWISRQDEKYQNAVGINESTSEKRGKSSECPMRRKRHS